MRQITRVATRAAACVAFAAGGVIAAANPVGAGPPTEQPAEPPAPAATSTVTLPLLGAPVMVDVTTDAGGGLLDVTLSPSDTLTANPVHLNHVSFVNEDGTIKLRVAAVWGAERVSARAGSLAEISGPGGWSGDVFGTGETTDVAFTIGATAEGAPDITGVTVTSPLEHTIGEVRYDSEGDDRSAKVTIEFTDQGQKRWLTIKVTQDDDGDDNGDDNTDDGDSAGSAGVKVSLSHPWGPRLVEGDAVGAHTWTGMLCDGTTATVNYTVTEAGEITDISATPEADVRTMGKFAWVAFDRHQGVSIFAHDRGEGLEVGATEKIRCERTAPTVNGEEAETAGGPRWGDSHDHDERDGDGWGDDRQAPPPRDGGSGDGPDDEQTGDGDWGDGDRDDDTGDDAGDADWGGDEWGDRGDDDGWGDGPGWDG